MKVYIEISMKTGLRHNISKDINVRTVDSFFAKNLNLNYKQIVFVMKKNVFARQSGKNLF